MRSLFLIISFFFSSLAIFGQSENAINSIIEESLINYFNIRDSIQAHIGMTKNTERYVCMEGLPLGYDYNKNNLIKFHDGSYYAIKKLKKQNERGINSASVFLNFQNECFVVSIANRFISYKNRHECLIATSYSVQFKYKYDSKTNSWKCISHTVTAL